MENLRYSNVNGAKAIKNFSGDQKPKKSLNQSKSPENHDQKTAQQPKSHNNQGLLSTNKDLKIVTSWKNNYRAGPGLYNAGNTCFLNSVLQTLTHTPPFVNYLMDKTHSKNCKVSPSGKFCALCTFERHVERCFNGKQKAIEPTEILRNIKLVNKKFRIGRQEDSHEFLRDLVDCFLKSCAGNIEKPTPAQLETTEIGKIFGGKLKSTVECMDCHYKSEIFEIFYDLSLELGKYDSIEKCMDMFFKTEDLKGSNKYKCSGCKNTVDATKKYTIFKKEPAVLTIHLKRFDNIFMRISKISRQIKFKETINLSPYMEEKSNPNLYYDLHAIIIHMGAFTTSGHYYSYVKSPGDVWHLMNDSDVRPTKIDTVLSQSAYILVYVLRGEVDSDEPQGKKTPRSQSNVPQTMDEEPVKPSAKNELKVPQSLKEQKKPSPVKEIPSEKNLDKAKQTASSILEEKVSQKKNVITMTINKDTSAVSQKSETSLPNSKPEIKIGGLKQDFKPQVAEEKVIEKKIDIEIPKSASQKTFEKFAKPQTKIEIPKVKGIFGESQVSGLKSTLSLFEKLLERRPIPGTQFSPKIEPINIQNEKKKGDQNDNKQKNEDDNDDDDDLEEIPEFVPLERNYSKQLEGLLDQREFKNYLNLEKEEIVKTSPNFQPMQAPILRRTTSDSFALKNTMLLDELPLKRSFSLVQSQPVTFYVKNPPLFLTYMRRTPLMKLKRMTSFTNLKKRGRSKIDKSKLTPTRRSERTRSKKSDAFKIIEETHDELGNGDKMFKILNGKSKKEIPRNTTEDTLYQDLGDGQFKKIKSKPKERKSPEHNPKDGNDNSLKKQKYL